MGFTANVTRFVDGTVGSAATLNAPVAQLNDNDVYLKDLITSLQTSFNTLATGQAAVKTGLAMKSDVSAGDAVFWKSSNSRYEKAVADGTSSGLFAGFCLTKDSSTVGSLVTAGFAELSPNLQGVETIQAGEYWLSQTEAGAITSSKPSTGAVKLAALADGAGNLVVVNDDRSTSNQGSVDTGTTTNTYASILSTGTVSKGLILSATLKNTDASNTLQYKLEVTDVFGDSTTIEDTVPPGGAAVFSSFDIIDTLLPPYANITLSVMAETAGLQATYSLGWLKNADS